MEKMIPERAISGTHGEIWIDGEKFAEAYGLQAKADFIKEKVPMCGVPSGQGQKYMGWEGKGTLRITKVNSRLTRKVAEQVKRGVLEPMTIVSKLADPAAFGAERVVLTGCTFDDLTLADWESGKIVQEEKPFTFTDFDFIDYIE
jgi:Phage tail tube protein